jgi:hypothetical protein
LLIWYHYYDLKARCIFEFRADDDSEDDARLIVKTFSNKNQSTKKQGRKSSTKEGYQLMTLRFAFFTLMCLSFPLDHTKSLSKYSATNKRQRPNPHNEVAKTRGQTATFVSSSLREVERAPTTDNTEPPGATEVAVTTTRVLVKGVCSSSASMVSPMHWYTEDQMKQFCRIRFEQGWASIADDLKLKDDLIKG